MWVCLMHYDRIVSELTYRVEMVTDASRIFHQMTENTYRDVKRYYLNFARQSTLEHMTSNNQVLCFLNNWQFKHESRSR